jgi:hypothetical protein
MPVHDPVQHLKNLRLALGQDKAPIGLLLAAGCGAAVKVGGQPLIPTIAGTTQHVARTLEAGPDAGAFGKLVSCIDADGNASATIEDWLSSVRALAAVARGGPVRGLTSDELLRLEQAITEGIVEIVDKELPASVGPFHAVAAWAGARDRAHPVEIFTTNYDLLLEQAFEALRRPYFDGFVGARNAFFDNASIAEGHGLPTRFTRVWKLHGSINWRVHADGIIRTQAEDGAARLIHPSHLKYEESREMPYIALLDRIRTFLAQRGALLVTCGYSFGDQHINAVTRSALQANPTAAVFGLMRSGLSKYPDLVDLARKQPNFSVWCKDGGVIGCQEGDWVVTDVPDRPLAGLELRTEPGPGVVVVGDFVVFGEFLAELMSRVDP